jgi:hypothetical protein
MAFQSKSLSSLAYANGFTVWHYRTGDLAAEIDNAGYFDAAAEMLRAGDFVLVNAGQGDVQTHGVMVVVSAGGGTADVANINAFATSNSD